MSTPKYQLEPVPFTKITFDDTFWSPRLAINRKVTLPHVYQQCVRSGRLDAFGLNFQRPVPSPIVLIFGDSDIAKWVEAASYSLASHPDPDLDTLIDQVAEKIIHAQQPDGYLNTHFTAIQPDMRWRNLRDWHELYCAGHLIEAAVAHYTATGKRSILDAMCKYADLIDETFGSEPDKKHGYCGHPEIELALVRLYHATDNPRYLKLAAYFIEERGSQPHYYDIEAQARGEDPAKFWAKSYDYCQAQVPIREQTKVVGHAVRAMYLLSAVADIANENHDQTLLDTCTRLWDNLVNRRMYITGGIGPAKHNEGFTEDYDLPDESAYAETCASIAMIQWNQRLLQFSGESKYADIIEQSLYNGILSSISLDGTHFFYENPLASMGNHHRQPWFECPCCPPNLARTLASLGGYFYSTGIRSLWVHLFARGTAVINVDGRDISLRQVTNYPWDGNIKLELQLPAPQTFTLHLRLPGWCEKWNLSINGTPMAGIQPEINGYLAVEREWHTGDVVEYTMEMPIQTVWANPAVRFLQGRLAIQRGPIIYCLEGVDHGNILLDRIAVNPQNISEDFIAEYHENLLGGINILHGKGELIDETGWEGRLYRHQPPSLSPVEITAIPYYAWDNRAAGEMRVWIRSII